MHCPLKGSKIESKHKFCFKKLWKMTRQKDQKHFNFVWPYMHKQVPSYKLATSIKYITHTGQCIQLLFVFQLGWPTSSMATQPKITFMMSVYFRKASIFMKAFKVLCIQSTHIGTSNQSWEKSASTRNYL